MPVTIRSDVGLSVAVDATILFALIMMKIEFIIGENCNTNDSTNQIVNGWHQQNVNRLYFPSVSIR